MVKPQKPDDAGESSGEGTMRERVAETGEQLREVGHVAKDAAEQSFHRVREAARAKYDQGVDRVKKFEATLEDRIRERPIRSVLIAAGAGFLLGSCLLVSSFVRRR